MENTDLVDALIDLKTPWALQPSRPHQMSDPNREHLLMTFYLPADAEEACRAKHVEYAGAVFREFLGSRVEESRAAHGTSGAPLQVTCRQYSIDFEERGDQQLGRGVLSLVRSPSPEPAEEHDRGRTTDRNDSPSSSHSSSSSRSPSRSRSRSASEEDNTRFEAFTIHCDWPKAIQPKTAPLQPAF